MELLKFLLLLTLEDGYCDYPKSVEPIESISDDVCLKEINGFKSFQCETSTSDGTSVECPIGLAVANMSCQVYSLGEGTVGKVASSAKHCWIFSDKVYSGINSKLVEYPDEWALQFAAGIKTILLVPVTHGVVQLGSLEMVDEDLMLVARIKDMFNTLQYIGGTPLPLTLRKDLLALQPSSLASLFLENLADPFAIPSNMLNPIQTEALMKNPFFWDDSQTTEIKLSNISHQFMPLSFVQDSFQVLRSTKDAEFDVLSMDSSEEASVIQNQFLNANHSEIMEGNMLSFPSLEEGLQASYQCDGPNIGDTNLNMDFYPVGDMMDQPFRYETIDEMDQIDISGFSNFSIESELYKALGPDFQRGTNEFLFDSTIPCQDICGRSNPTWHRDLTGRIEQADVESNSCFKKGSDAEHLLGAMVANLYGSSDDTASYRSNNVSLTTSSGQLGASYQTQCPSEGRLLVGDDSVPWYKLRSSFVSGGKQVTSTTQPGASSLTSMMSKVIDKEQRKKEFGSKRGSKSSHVNQRKSKSIDIQRPRPRDRQMIQDRVKELRELVPNGAKFSIDALLDQTIKHMLFLRSVANQAKKLGQCMRPKNIGCKNWKSGSQSHQNGTRPFQMGTQLGACPIVVEDLDYPGHMLIEMLCDEHGLFLEIAQVIRHLELTIIKGVMESRSNKIWAHFIVEASSGFQRTDVFWPLMQLLQRSGNPIASKF
ncbi:PREDICTED: transcription factor bHLH155-like isoform X2 [Nelumbo nucifera]|uniref:Transcription factor bHLH155-like isoform X2 n=1 Tax=Nelumbo nucifera TaxID=4432 RepID=A0A1U8AJD1_NELNU|nr:PREDICTED: transcription factor bHLH155-like isoform X2 [Nelumbo nucifera]